MLTHYSVPFHLKEVMGGFAEAEGLLTYENESIHLEYQIKDAIVGQVKSGVKRFELAFADISRISFVKKWFKTELRIAMKSLQQIADIDSVEGHEVVLRFKKKNRSDAENLYSKVNLDLSEWRLRQIED